MMALQWRKARNLLACISRTHGVSVPRSTQLRVSPHSQLLLETRGLFRP